jgi:hypothetical protein
VNDILSLQLAALPPVALPRSSRYYGIEVARVEIDGRTHTFFRRRFVPDPKRFAAVGEHVVTQGQRLDQIAATALGDPELFWRLCDANRGVRPDELTEEIGRRLLVTLPEGVPGVPNG